MALLDSPAFKILGYQILRWLDIYILQYKEKTLRYIT